MSRNFSGVVFMAVLLKMTARVNLLGMVRHKRNLIVPCGGSLVFKMIKAERSGLTYCLIHVRNGLINATQGLFISKIIVIPA